MGGIYGFINKKKTFSSQELIEKMKNSLTHQDWHSDELIIEEKYAFGRKGVVPSNFQPLYNKDGNNFIFLDGDIFSIKDNTAKHKQTFCKDILRDILDMHKEFSSEFVNLLDGEFNILIGDSKKEYFTIANDIFGLRHLYYYDDENIFIFSPEIDPLLQYSGLNKELNFASISDYFHYNTLIHNNTYFKNIKLLPPASVLKIDQGKLRVQKYWSPSYVEDRVDDSYDSLLEEGYELWKNAIHKRIKGKENIAIPLSGGLDSRLLVAFTAMKNTNIYAFTHDEKGGDEHRIAQIVARYFNIPKYELFQFDGNSILNNVEESVRLKGGMVQHGAILLDIIKKMGNQYDIFLNGSFAMGLSFTSHYIKEDEINKEFTEDEKVRRISQKCGEKNFSFLMHGMLNKDFHNLLQANYGLSIREGLNDFAEYSDTFHKQKDLFLIQTLKRRRGVGIDLWKYYVNDVLPLADYNLFDFYLRLPVKYKLNREFHYEIIRRFFPDLARIEYQRTGTDLFSAPSKYVQLKRKYGPLAGYYLGRLTQGKINLINKGSFDNSNIWFRENKKLQDYFTDILTSQRTKQRGYFNTAGIENILTKEMKGGNYYNSIAQLVEFELTCRLFFD